MAKRKQWFEILRGKTIINRRQAENKGQALHRFLKSWGLHAASDEAKRQYIARRSRAQQFIRLPDHPKIGRKMSGPELVPYRD